MFGKHTITGTPKKLAYSYETDRAALEVQTPTRTYALWAEGGIAFALLRQVTREVQTIVVTVDSHDPTKIVAFALP